MRKKVAVLSFFLLIPIVGILYYQWSGYGSLTASDGPHSRQSITIRHYKNELNIEQKVEKLPEGEWSLKVPAGIEGLKCRVEKTDTPCDWKDKNKSRLLMAKDAPVTLTYRLATPNQPGSLLLEDWAIAVGDLKSKSIRIQLSEQTWKNGTWMAAAQMTGKKKLDLMDYYVFETKKSQPTLYWQKGEMTANKVSEHLTVYSPPDSRLNTKVLRKLTPEKPLFYVITEHAPDLKQKNSFLVPPGKTPDQHLIRTLWEMRMPAAEYGGPFTEVILSLLTEVSPDEQKDRKMAEAMRESLTKKQLEDWLHLVLHSASPLTAELLDSYLREAAGLKVDFFVNNHDTDRFQPFRPLDGRQLYINGKKADAISIRLLHDRGYIPIVPLMRKLGYQMVGPDKGSQGKFKKDDTVYWFFYEEKIFYRNGKAYGFTEKPFLQEKDEVLLDIRMLPDLLGIHMNETQNEIRIEE